MSEEIKLILSQRFYSIFQQGYTFEEFIDYNYAVPVSQFSEEFLKRFNHKIETAIKTENYDMDYLGFESLDLSENEKLEITEELVKNYALDSFHNAIYFASEINKILNLRDATKYKFDLSVYKEIKEYTNQFYTIYRRTLSEYQLDREKIQNGNYSEDLKTTAKICMHEMNVKFHICQAYIQADFSFDMDQLMTCQFYFDTNKEFHVFDCEIYDHRFLIHTDGTFQFRAVVYNERYELEDIFINFSNLKLKTTDESFIKRYYNLSKA